MLGRISFTKILNQEYFFVYDLSYDLQTYIKQSASHVTITDQFQVKDKSRVFQDKSLISYTHLRNDSNSNVTMPAASLSTIELNSFNNAIFSAINRIRHILKQRADINRVLNELKKSGI